MLSKPCYSLGKNEPKSLSESLDEISFIVATTADCGPPPFLLNGAVSYQNTTEGSEGRYQCNDGFTLEGRRKYVEQMAAGIPFQTAGYEQASLLQ